MDKRIVILAGILVLLLVIGCSESIDPAKEIPTKTQEEYVDDLTKEEIVEAYLENKGYIVNGITEDYDEALGYYIYLGMDAVIGETEIAEQVGTGFGVLYGGWETKDWYLVAIDAGTLRCTFGVEHDIIESYMNGYITDEELFSSIESVCDDI